MIKIVFCLRRKPGLSIAEFQDYWLNKHGPMVRQYGPLIGMRRYVQSHRLTDPRYVTAGVASRKSGVEPYDGIAEAWFDDIEAVNAATSTQEGKRIGSLFQADEHTFIDVKNTAMFYSEEYEIIGPGTAVPKPA
jgi:uncharacterized protein (TIGR02118 family)